MAEVTILSNTYFVYADVDTANDYLAAAFHADAWSALTSDDTKAKALVTAARTIDRQCWKGTKTDSAQDGEWPRDDTGVDGVINGVTPQDVINASIEMALAFVDGSELQNEATIEQRIQQLKAGSVSLTFFRGIDGTQQRFPQIIMELLRKYLCGYGDDVGGPITSGTGGTSISNKEYGYSRGI